MYISTHTGSGSSSFCLIQNSFSSFFVFVCVCVQFSQHAIKKHSFKIKYNLDIVLVVDDFVWGYVGVEGSVVALECPEGHHHRDRRRVHCH